MKIALVYDRVLKFGGAERILLALKELWPDSTLFTAFYDSRGAQWAKSFQVKESFLKIFPFMKNNQGLALFLTPFAFESFTFDEYDLVISVTSQDAKCIITKPATCHICYCLTPTRYLWSGFEEYYRQPSAGLFNPVVKLIMKLTLPALRIWDYLSAKRPDTFLAISKTVKKRIFDYYGCISEVIYPPIDSDVFRIPEYEPALDYYLIVSRLVPYKRIDYAINAFNRLKYPLKIIGSGIDENRLRGIADSNIEFISGDLTDQKLCWYYQNCRSLIFPGDEDFGLTSLEAQACGRPVIALNKGGTTESVVDKLTGILYKDKTDTSLIEAIDKFNKHHFLPKVCRANALRFSRKEFKKLMRQKIERYWAEYQKTL